MSLIRDFYFGNYNPYEQPPTKREMAALDQLCKAEDALLSLLDVDGKRVYEQLADCQRELSSLAQENAYVQGVRFGARFVMEITGGNDE